MWCRFSSLDLISWFLFVVFRVPSFFFSLLFVLLLLLLFLLSVIFLLPLLFYLLYCFIILLLCVLRFASIFLLGLTASSFFFNLVVFIFGWLLSSLSFLFGIMKRKSWNESQTVRLTRKGNQRVVQSQWGILPVLWNVRLTHLRDSHIKLDLTRLGCVSVWLLHRILFFFAVHLCFGVSDTPSCHRAGTEVKPQMQPYIPGLACRPHGNVFR